MFHDPTSSTTGHVWCTCESMQDKRGIVFLIHSFYFEVKKLYHTKRKFVAIALIAKILPIKLYYSRMHFGRVVADHHVYSQKGQNDENQPNDDAKATDRIHNLPQVVRHERFENVDDNAGDQQGNPFVSSSVRETSETF